MCEEADIVNLFDEDDDELELSIEMFKEVRGKVSACTIKRPPGDYTSYPGYKEPCVDIWAILENPKELMLLKMSKVGMVGHGEVEWRRGWRLKAKDIPPKQEDNNED